MLPLIIATILFLFATAPAVAEEAANNTTATLCDGRTKLGEHEFVRICVVGPADMLPAEPIVLFQEDQSGGHSSVASRVSARSRTRNASGQTEIAVAIKGRGRLMVSVREQVISVGEITILGGYEARPRASCSPALTELRPAKGQTPEPVTIRFEGDSVTLPQMESGDPNYPVTIQMGKNWVRFWWSLPTINRASFYPLRVRDAEGNEAVCLFAPRW